MLIEVAAAIKKGDYIGLDLLAQLDVDARKEVDLHFLLEHSDIVIDLLRLEVSIDGYNWVSAKHPAHAVSAEFLQPRSKSLVQYLPFNAILQVISRLYRALLCQRYS